jgi:hypothetical protein
MGQQRLALSEVCGAAVDASTGDIQLSWDDHDAAAIGVASLKELFTQPVATIAVPTEAKGAIIGKGGSNLERLAGLEGVFSCGLAGDPPLVGVVARDSAALRSVIESLVAVTGVRMTVPDQRFNGKLIGPQGAVVNELRERSGCLHASVERGSNTWTLRATSGDSIREFVRLANERVVGCELGSPIADLAVRDEVLGVAVDDWAEHEFSPAEVPALWHRVLDA